VAARVDYETHGVGYSHGRRADPRIEARIHAALGDARTVLNVGAGTGSYEPRDRWVLAVEPSATMRAQRGPDAAPCLAAGAESLPLDDDSVASAMACVTIPHWADRAGGLAEMRRVSRGPVVVFTFDLADLIGWQRDYFAEAVAIE
jgi:SAM-dependent methyltransferase